MSYFDDAMIRLAPIEGGYANDPRDPGGQTAPGGLTEKVARAYGYTGEMRTMPRAEVVRIVRAEFWDMLRLDEVSQMSPAVAFELFECNYNLPYGKAVSFLQTTLNALNNDGRLYPDLSVDGAIGSRTLSALGTYLRLSRRGDREAVLLRALNSLQCAHYLQGKERFVYGWILNRVKVE